MTTLFPCLFNSACHLTDPGSMENFSGCLSQSMEENTDLKLEKAIEMLTDEGPVSTVGMIYLGGLEIPSSHYALRQGLISECWLYSNGSKPSSPDFQKCYFTCQKKLQT